MANAPIDPARLESDTEERPAMAKSKWKAIASIAPSAAPLDTPSVSGVARGFLSRAWKMAPASASELPTSAAARTRGRRATKKIWASALSANGIDRSNTRASEIDVVPMSGAATSAASSSPPKPAVATIRRPRTCCTSGPRDRRDRQVPRSLVQVDVGLNVVEGANVGGREHVGRWAARQDAAVADEDQTAAQAGGEVQVVRREDHR